MRKASALFLMTIFFSSCASAPRLKRECEGGIPRLARHFDEATSALTGRAPASSSNGVLSEDERDDWTSWAEKRLTEAQHAMDASEEDPSRREARRSFSEIATLLVQFHGQAQQGRAERMRKTLEKVQAEQVKAWRTACE